MIKIKYDPRSNTTEVRCDICKEWYFEDEVIGLDCNGNATNDFTEAENVYCNMCYENNEI